MISIIVLRQLVGLFFVILLGYIAAKTNIFNQQAIKCLSAYLTKIGIPIALILSINLPYSTQRLMDLGVMMVGMTVVTAVGVCVGLVICFLRKIPLRETGAWVACGAFSNSIFMGRPILLSIYGEEGMFALAALMFTFNVLCFTVGIYLLGLGDPEKKRSLKQMLRTIMLNNGILGAVLGFILFLFSIQIPQPLLVGMEMVNGTLSPVGMIIIGYSLAQNRIRDLFIDHRVYLVSFVKLLAMPLLSFLLLKKFIQDPVLLGVLCIGCAMPTANSMSALSTQMDNHPILCSKLTFGSTLISILTIPLCAALIQGGL